MGLDPKIMEFQNDSGVSEIVGDKDYFISKESFTERANIDFLDYNDKPYQVQDVEEGYVKWYDNPDDACVAPLDIFENGCYSFANEDEEGAFEVYIINVQN